MPNVEHPHKTLREYLDKEAPSEKKKPCGSHTLYTEKGAVKLFCGRKDCPLCGPYRIAKASSALRMASIRLHDDLIYFETLNSQRDMVKKRFCRAQVVYAVFPTPDGLTWVTFKQWEDVVKDLGPKELHAEFIKDFAERVVSVTPDGSRIRFSMNFPNTEEYPQEEEGKKKEAGGKAGSGRKFITDMSLPNFANMLKDMGVEFTWRRDFTGIRYKLQGSQWDEIQDRLCSGNKVWEIVPGQENNGIHLKEVKSWQSELPLAA